MVREVIIEPANNGFFVAVYYKENEPDKIFCRSTAQINAVLKQLFPKEKKAA